MKKSFISSLSIYISTGVNIVFTFLASVYVIRYLSVDDYGAYKLIASIITLATYLTSFGLENTLGRFIPEFLSKGNYRNVNRLLLLALAVRITTVIIFIGILLFFKNPIFSFLNFPDILLTWLTLICILIFIERTKSLFGRQLLASYMEVYLDNLNLIFVCIIRFILFVFVVINNWGIKGLILSILTVDILSFTYLLILAVKKCIYNRNKYGSSKETIEYKRISRFSFYSFLDVTTGVFKEIMIDNFVISYYFGASMVGLYSFAAVLVGIVRQLNPISALRTVFNPLVVKKYYDLNKDKNILIFFYGFFNKLFFFLSIPMLLGLGIISKEIITFVYHPKYLQVLPVVYILIFSYSIGLLEHTFRTIINVLEINQLFLYSGVFSIYNLIMDIILIAKFGIIGAAIATGSALILQYFYYYYFVRKLTKINFVFPFKSLLKTLFNLIPMIVFLFLFKPFITNMGFLITAIILSMIIYFIASYINKLFSEREREMINAAVGKKVWVF